MDFLQLIDGMNNYAYRKFIERFPDIESRRIYDVSLSEIIPWERITDNDDNHDFCEYDLEFLVLVKSEELDELNESGFTLNRYYACVYTVYISMFEMIQYFYDQCHITNINIQDIIDQMLEIKC